MISLPYGIMFHHFYEEGLQPDKARSTIGCLIIQILK
jgi:hypothetical protein